jgi:hypothetical protein
MKIFLIYWICGTIIAFLVSTFLLFLFPFPFNIIVGSILQISIYGLGFWIENELKKDAKP